MSWLTDSATGRFVAIDPVDLLWAGVTFGPSCWEWNREKNSTGYGRVSIKTVETGGKRQRILAHKLAFQEAYGPIPDGMIVRHKCDNKACVRWDHLTFGTYRQNSRDAVERGQIKSGHELTCRRGHTRSKANTYYTKRGKPMCRVCRRLVRNKKPQVVVAQ